MSNSTNEIMDERIVKLSICPICKGWVSAGAWEHFDKKDKSQFMRDAAKIDADVISLPVQDFKGGKIEICGDDCKRKKNP